MVSAESIARRFGSLKRAALPIPSSLPGERALPAKVVTTASGVIMRMVSIQGIGYEKISCAINGDAVWTIEASLTAGPVVAAGLARRAGKVLTSPSGVILRIV
jgi:hypothetical protein